MGLSTLRARNKRGILCRSGPLPVLIGEVPHLGHESVTALVFEKLLGYANHLGLYAEELGRDGRHLGNFPQAFTHLALISAASYLDRALSGAKEVWR